MSGTEGWLNPPNPPTSMSAVNEPREVSSRQLREPSSQSAPVTSWPKRM